MPPEPIGSQHGITASCNRLRDLDPAGTICKKRNGKWTPITGLPMDLSVWGAWDKLERSLTILVRDHDASVQPPKKVSGVAQASQTVGVMTNARNFKPPTDPPVDPPPGDLDIDEPVGPFETLDSNYTQAMGVELRNSGGGSITKKDISRYTGWGVLNMQYYPPGPYGSGTTTIEDCIVEDITSDPPRIMDGTGEAGFWFGNTTIARRLIARRCAWMGMWTGSQNDNSLIEHFQLLEMPHVGLYVEHDTWNNTFQNFRIEAEGTGINIEWWYGGHGSYGCTFQDAEIYCPVGTHWTNGGIFVDAGNYGMTFRRIRFYGPGNAIWLPNNLVVPGSPNVIEDCVFEQDGEDVQYHSNAIG